MALDHERDGESHQCSIDGYAHVALQPDTGLSTVVNCGQRREQQHEGPGRSPHAAQNDATIVYHTQGDTVSFCISFGVSHFVVQGSEDLVQELVEGHLEHTLGGSGRGKRVGGQRSVWGVHKTHTRIVVVVVVVVVGGGRRGL